MLKDERKICPAIWIDDGKSYSKQPKNIKTGYVVYGLNIVDIFRNLNNKYNCKLINFNSKNVNKVTEGYFTNKDNFIKKLIDY